MTDVQIMAGDLTASVEERVVSGLLLPYGEIGRTNLGRFSIDAPGIISIPEDLSVLVANEDHSQVEPRARFLTATDSPAGIFASFKLGTNPECEALLARIDEGRKNGKPIALSAEVKGVVIDKATLKATGGRLTGAAFVERGAFPSATLMAADASLPGADGPLEPTDGVITITATAVPDSVDVTVGDSTTTFTSKEETEVPATAPNTLAASSTAQPGPPDKREILAIMEAYRNGQASDTMLARLDGQFTKGGQGNLFAALNDVKYDATGAPKPYESTPAWIGELYHGVEYQQLVAPLLSHGDLTSKNVSGFRWDVRPAGDTWTGNKTAISSNSPATTPYTDSADLWAGGHDIAIEHKLFNTPGYFEAYWSAMLESYQRWVDAKALAKLLAQATQVTADNPSGLAIGAGMSALIDGAASVVAAGAVPTFALLAPALWKQIVKTPQTNTLGYLNAALGFKEGTLENSGFVIRPHAGLATGNVLVGARPAATLKELPGTPVRIEAPDTVKGGIDTNMFGAALVEVHMPAAFQLVKPYTA